MGDKQLHTCPNFRPAVARLHSEYRGKKAMTLECPCCEEPFDPDNIFGCEAQCPHCYFYVKWDWDYVGSGDNNP